MNGSALMNIVGIMFIALGMSGAYFDAPEVFRAACYVIANVWIVGSMIVRGQGK